MASTGWAVDTACPQCGAPVTLDETERLLTCAYCRVTLYVATEGRPRYVLPPREGPAGRLIMVPYWRRSGARFRCIAWQVAAGIVDVTALACQAPGMPATLGIRPQAMRLRFAVPDADTTFLEPVGQPVLRLPPSVTSLDSGTASEEPAFAELCLGSTSIVYTPVRLSNQVLDAVLNRRLPSAAEQWEEVAAAAPASLPAPRFLSTLCPECGWQLSGRGETLVLLCGHCHSAWHAAESRLARLPHRTLARGCDAPALHLPFWQVVPSVEGLPLASWADFVRFANLPRRIQPAWKSEPLVLWIPAFRSRPDQFLRYCRNLTSVHPALDDLPAASERDVTNTATVARAAAVTLPASELATAVKVLLSDVGQPKLRFFPQLDEVEVRVASASLVYVPLSETTQEYVNQDLHLTVQRNVLPPART